MKLRLFCVNVNHLNVWEINGTEEEIVQIIRRM